MLRYRFDLSESVEIDQPARYNVAPTDPVFAVRQRDEGEREAGRLRWGLTAPEEADNPGRGPINARAETVAKAPPFRDAFASGRCLIVADGFYEWQQTERGKRPIWITRPERDLFAFAGISRGVKRADGSELHSCAIITCPPGELVAPIHDRMPVILERDAEGSWLDRNRPRDDLLALLRPTDDLELTEVSDAVNDVRNDGPELIEPALRLF
jgi:putative SOS response-associated peptidase YedK